MKKQFYKSIFAYILIGVVVFFLYILLVEISINTVIRKLVEGARENVKTVEPYNFLDLLERRSQDIMMKMRTLPMFAIKGTTYSKRTVASNDIMIIAVDETSLNKIGRWPFDRYVHRNIVEYFSKSKYRENTLFFDIFFVEPQDNNPEYDYVFMEEIKKNGRTVFDYIGGDASYNTKREEAEMNSRVEHMIETFGALKNVSGTVEKAHQYLSLTMPLVPYMDVLSDTAVANVAEDNDQILRRYPLVGKYRKRKELKFSSLKAGDYADTVYFMNYSIGFNKKIKEYFLKLESDEVLYDQSALSVNERKELAANDVGHVKFKMDKAIDDFQLELDKLGAKVEQNHRGIIEKVIKYTGESSMPDADKKQILAFFKTDGISKDLDIHLDTMITYFKKKDKGEGAFKSEIDYFTKMRNSCLTVRRDSDERIIGGKKSIINLYEFLYGKKKLPFDIVIHYEKYFMSIPLLLAARYFHVDRDNIEVVYGKNIIFKNPMVFSKKTKKLEKPVIDGKTLDEVVIPIDDFGYFSINFFGKASQSNRKIASTYDVYSYSDIANNEVSVLVENKIAMVGAFAKGMAKDYFQTPHGTMYGIEVIANTVNTIVKNKYIRYPKPWVYFLIMLIMSVLVALIASNKNVFRAYMYTVLFVVFYSATVITIFSFYDLVLQIPRVIIISLMSLVSVVVFRIFTEEKQKKEVKNIFGKYVNASVVDQLLIHPPKLGGDDMDITVQFSDIRGFTTLSEALTSQELVQVLNKYLTVMTDIILEENGTLDKYIGDAIMCFWGAPQPYDDHAELAARAALRQMTALAEINKELPEHTQIAIGIGLNSGIMTAGNMGSEGRMNYTIMGDNVNLGSRLEGVTKMYGVEIIVSEYTYEKIKDKFICRELDNIKVKGKKKPVRIYELLAEKSDLLPG